MDPRVDESGDVGRREVERLAVSLVGGRVGFVPFRTASQFNPKRGSRIQLMDVVEKRGELTRIDFPRRLGSRVARWSNGFQNCSSVSARLTANRSNASECVRSPTICAVIASASRSCWRLSAMYAGEDDHDIQKPERNDREREDTSRAGARGGHLVELRDRRCKVHHVGEGAGASRRDARWFSCLTLRSRPRNGASPPKIHAGRRRATGLPLGDQSARDNQTDRTALGSCVSRTGRCLPVRRAFADGSCSSGCVRDNAEALSEGCLPQSCVQTHKREACWRTIAGHERGGQLERVGSSK